MACSGSRGRHDADYGQAGGLSSGLCTPRRGGTIFIYTAACACVRASIDTQFSTLMCTTRLRVCVEKTAVGVVCYYVCVCSRVIGPIFFTL